MKNILEKLTRFFATEVKEIKSGFHNHPLGWTKRNGISYWLEEKTRIKQCTKTWLISASNSGDAKVFYLVDYLGITTACELMPNGEVVNIDLQDTQFCEHKALKMAAEDFRRDIDEAVA